MRLSQPVRVCSRSAGPVTKETPTAMRMKAEKKTRNFLTPLPRYLPTMSGRLMPSLRKMGPRPAILRNWMMNILQGFISW